MARPSRACFYKRHASARLDLGSAAVAMIVTVLVSRIYLLTEDTPVDPPAGWTLIPRHLWALAAVAFLSLFIEGAIGDWGTVYLRSTLHVSAATAATGYAAFSLSMMTGCFVGDHLNMKLGATNLLRLSGALVVAGFGFTLVGTTYAGAMIGLLVAGFGTSNMIALIFGAAARRNPGGVGAAIAATSIIGYLGFLVGPPAVGSISGLLGLREPWRWLWWRERLSRFAQAGYFEKRWSRARFVTVSSASLVGDTGYASGENVSRSGPGTADPWLFLCGGCALSALCAVNPPQRGGIVLFGALYAL